MSWLNHIGQVPTEKMSLILMLILLGTVMLITASCRDEPGEALTTDLPEGMVYFPTETPRVGETEFRDADLRGRLELRDGCLRVNAEHRDDGPVILWPAGFVLRLGEDGIIEVHDGLGRTVVRVGDRLEAAGAPNKDSLGPCQGPHWYDTRIEKVIRDGHETPAFSEIPTAQTNGPESSPLSQREAAPMAIIGQCRHVETGEALQQVKDAQDTLWDVEMLPGSPAGCAIPWEAAVYTDGSSYILIVVDENGKEISQKTRVREQGVPPRQWRTNCDRAGTRQDFKAPGLQVAPATLNVHRP